jgi:hypothetical protein
MAYQLSAAQLRTLESCVNGETTEGRLLGTTVDPIELASRNSLISMGHFSTDWIVAIETTAICVVAAVRNLGEDGFLDRTGSTCDVGSISS